MLGLPEVAPPPCRRTASIASVIGSRASLAERSSIEYSWRGKLLKDDDLQAAEERLHGQAHREEVRITQHAQQEMTEEGIFLEEVLEVLRAGTILENYPEHRRGPCCLVWGYTRKNRPLHVVCTTTRPVLIVITVYEPMPPKWITTTTRKPVT
jgi:Domain of unknown function (DUF4258)